MEITKEVMSTETVADISALDTGRIEVRDSVPNTGKRVLDINTTGIYVWPDYGGGLPKRGSMVAISNLAAVIAQQASLSDLPGWLKEEVIQEYRASTRTDVTPKPGLPVPNAEFICALVAAGVGAVPIIQAISSVTGVGLREAKHLYDEAARVDTGLVRSLTDKFHTLARVLTELRIAEKSALERKGYFDWDTMLSCAFIWENSPQGKTFWDEVNQGKRIL